MNQEYTPGNPHYQNPKWGEHHMSHIMQQRIVKRMSYQSVNPATGKVLEKFKEITNKELETSLKTAATCFETWQFKTFTERAFSVDVLINVETDLSKSVPATP